MCDKERMAKLRRKIPAVESPSFAPDNSHGVAEEITRENCGVWLSKLRELSGNLSREELSHILGVSRTTVLRIEEKITQPSDELMNRLKAVQLIGASKLSVLNAQEREVVFKMFGENTDGANLDADAIRERLMKRLTVAGVISGLGILALTAVNPMAIGVIALPSLARLSFAGYGLIRGLGEVLKANGLTMEQIDDRWEIRNVPTPAKTGKKETLQSRSNEQ